MDDGFVAIMATGERRAFGMKGSMKKRRVFDDAMDLFTGEMDSCGEVRMIPVREICPYHEHPFRLYEGERLENMVESIREHGVLNPVIVREMGNAESRYEMLAGHNRLNAARIAGLETVPAIVKKDLPDEEAYVYVVETNVMQRSFAELLPSEKAAVMSSHYQKMCGTMRRDEILRELQELQGKKAQHSSGGHNDHRTDGGKVRTRDLVAAEYGFSSRNAARYLRINYLIQPFKELIDDNRMALLAGVDISYLREDEQLMVWRFVDSCGWEVKPKTAAKLRERSGSLTEQVVAEAFEEPKKSCAGISIRINGELRNRYFDGMEKQEILTVIDRALEAWFERKEAG